jgi:hypothetical protein
MSAPPDLLDLFDTPAAPPEPVQDAPKAAAGTSHAPDRNQPCQRPFSGPHRCRVGGGDAGLSDDFGKTWFCVDHRPPGFFAKDRR